MPAHKKPAPRKSAKAAAPAKRPVRREVGALFCFFLAVFSGLSLFGVRAFFLDILSDLFRYILGWGFYALPFVMLLAAFILLFHRGRPVLFRLWCTLLVPVAVGALAHLFFAGSAYEWSFAMLGQLLEEGLTMTSGGLLCGLLALLLKAAISTVGAAIVLLAGLIFLSLVMCNMTLARFVDLLRRRDRPPYEPEPAMPPRAAKQPKPERPFKPSREILRRQVDIPLDDEEPPPPPIIPPLESQGPLLAPRPEHVLTPAEALTGSRSPVKPPFTIEDKAPPAAAVQPGQAAAPEADTEAEPAEGTPQPYRYPPLTLLTSGRPGNKVDGTGEIKINAERLLETIQSFGIDAKIVSVTRGPTVARYEIELDRGIKLSRLTGLADDIALSLGASGVRIAPVPDKMSVVGIEVPNKLVSTVYLHDVISSPEFTGRESKLSFAVGKDISGASIVCDISKLTHLLIAGTTGSGKSVCMNSLIISLLYKANPDEVRMVMIDPKMVELGIYNGIPHLEVPVVTDPKKAAGALHKVVLEMEERYKKFMERHVRDIFSYNAAIENEPDTPKMPQMVVIIDELADLMLVAAKEVEESICRIAQKARAAGLHLIIATQRPSADVITGLMKANIPSRIAFAVASQLESRIILDTMGAEKLVGRGDMLLFPLGAPKPSRVQGCLISSAEVEEVVRFVKQSGQARYSQEFMSSIEKYAEQVGKKGGMASVATDSEPAGGSDDYDDLFAAAVEVVLESGQASVSFLQRRLKLGFSRAARLVDQMEERGIVGPSEGSKPRQLRITRQQWQEVQMRQQESNPQP